jgi:hemoglobin
MRPASYRCRRGPDEALRNVTAQESSGATLYERVGGTAEGAAFFADLVGRFYDAVADDDVLLPLYPEQPDLSGARRRLTLFLVQYWGGPTTYSDERGHPRLRMRHLPFHVGPDERDRWLQLMGEAVRATCAARRVPDGVGDELMGYFRPTAEHLRNDTGLPISSPAFREAT